MEKKREDNFEKEYLELRLQYALENEKIKKLLNTYKKCIEEGTRYRMPILEDHLITELYKFKIRIIFKDLRMLDTGKLDNLDFRPIPCVEIKSICSSFDFKGRKTVSEAFKNLHDYDSNISKFNKEFDKKTKQYDLRRKYRNIIFRDQTLEENKYLNLRVNLSRKKKDIEQELGSIIDYFKDLADNLEMEKGKRQQDIDKYKDYLKVYQLRKKNKKWTEILEKVFPNDVDYESARIKAIQAYKRAEELIKEGLP